MRRAGTWLAMAAAVLTSTCSDRIQDVEEDTPQPAAVISNPILGDAGAQAGTARSAVFQAAGDEVVYVSLAPDSFPTGEVAILRNPRQEASVTASMRSGGLDAVPVAATAGDTVLISIRSRSGEEVGSLALAVPDARRPRVVRVSPTRKKRDVPLNMRPVIFFTEPVAGSTVTASSVQLFRGDDPVAGSVRLLEGTGAMAAFVPTEQLSENTEYRLVVTQAVEDLGGESLEASHAVSFTTGRSLTGPPAAIRLSPDTVVMTGTTYQMTATVEDAAGNILIDQPITWSTSDPSGLAVSPTGQLTALADGSYGVMARIGELVAGAYVTVRSPAAAITVTPQTATVAAGDTVMLTPTVRDAAGRPIQRGVTWSSSNPAVVTVRSLNTGTSGQQLGEVTGVAQGNATVTATSGAASATSAMTVGPPQPVASVTVTPSRTDVVVGSTVRLIATLRDASNRVIPKRPVVWTTDNAAAATVDSTGLVTGTGAGSASIVATSEGISDSAIVAVTATLSFTSVSSGFVHTCALRPSGSAYCWGFNGYGQLGEGTKTDRLTPVRVAGDLSFDSLSAGSFRNCALTAAGAAWCWGERYESEPGGSSYPTLVQGGLTFAQVSSGGVNCALATNSDAYCWTGPASPWLPAPSLLPGDLAFSVVSVGGYFCGLSASGAYCLRFTAPLGAPALVAGGLTFRSISVGGDHACALTAEGAANCGGNNSYGQLGDGTTTDRVAPVLVDGSLRFTAVEAGDNHTCGLTAGGTIYCWGGNNAGQLGDGTTTSRFRPTPVQSTLGFVALSGGGMHTCAIAADGSAYCWGANDHGQLGIGTSTGPESCGTPSLPRPYCSTLPVRVRSDP
ncbi:MAG: Ig-like domain-containing protein [Gemmatimonadetes bacterium]|nr:Ig-like domain-containing protein [Gemmatimonadota bacterium]